MAHLLQCERCGRDVSSDAARKVYGVLCCPPCAEAVRAAKIAKTNARIARTTAALRREYADRHRAAAEESRLIEERKQAKAKEKAERRARRAKSQVHHFPNEDAARAFIAGIGPWLTEKYGQEGYEVQYLGLPGSECPTELVFQARRTGVVRSVLGLRQVATVKMRRLAEQVTVEVGGAAWADKAAMGAVGLFVGLSTIVWTTAIVGAVKQGKLFTRLAEDISTAAASAMDEA